MSERIKSIRVVFLGLILVSVISFIVAEGRRDEVRQSERLESVLSVSSEFPVDAFVDRRVGPRFLTEVLEEAGLEINTSLLRQSLVLIAGDDWPGSDGVLPVSLDKPFQDFLVREYLDQLWLLGYRAEGYSVFVPDRPALVERLRGKPELRSESWVEISGVGRIDSGDGQASATIDLTTSSGTITLAAVQGTVVPLPELIDDALGVFDRLSVAERAMTLGELKQSLVSRLLRLESSEVSVLGFTVGQSQAVFVLPCTMAVLLAYLAVGFRELRLSQRPVGEEEIPWVLLGLSSGVTPVARTVGVGVIPILSVGWLLLTLERGVQGYWRIADVLSPFAVSALTAEFFFGVVVSLIVGGVAIWAASEFRSLANNLKSAAQLDGGDKPEERSGPSSGDAKDPPQEA
ncbi:MAG: hypothetical protein AAGI53_02205 [Planctomycetota bacterium]